MRSLLVVALTLVTLRGCGSSTPPAPQTVENRAPDASVPLADGCPPAWQNAVGAGACDMGVANRVCTYDEGTCYCGVEPYCSGAEPDPEWERSRPTTWQCSATPPAIRADGCPGTPPEEVASGPIDRRRIGGGGAEDTGRCARDGQRCSYGSCCVTEYVCAGGRWTRGQASCPP